MTRTVWSKLCVRQVQYSRRYLQTALDAATTDGGVSPAGFVKRHLAGGSSCKLHWMPPRPAGVSVPPDLSNFTLPAGRQAAGIPRWSFHRRVPQARRTFFQLFWTCASWRLGNLKKDIVSGFGPILGIFEQKNSKSQTPKTPNRGRKHPKRPKPPESITQRMRIA